ncbi:hypothetical protein [Nocardia sp. NPDC050710]|uniref:hypothetical protein n=1 Tax=Nocardia sp. NPDC050710 TaxID=3157220 RepID=UPI0033F9F85E
MSKTLPHSRKGQLMGDLSSGQSQRTQAEVYRSRTRPSNEIPATVAVDRILARTDDIAATLTGARVFSAGIELTIEVHLRRRRAGRSVLDVFGRGYQGGNKDQILIGIEFDDGRTATTLRQPEWDAPEDVPVLSSGAGSSSDVHGTTHLYLTPLPPPGRLSIIVAWPAYDIAEHRVELDSDALRAAAGRVVVLWPLEFEADPQPEPEVELPRLEPGGWFAHVIGY